MVYDDLKSQPIEKFLNEVQGLASVADESQVRSILALVARCTIEVSDRLTQLSTELERSSDIASQHTAALVRWTRVLVFVTAAYTLLTGGLLLATIFSSR